MRKIVALAVLLIIYSANAQKTDEKTIYSLESCIETALEKNFDIKLKEYQLDQANADMKEAFGRYLPGMNYTFNYSRQLNAGQAITYQSPSGKTMILGGANNYSMGLTATLPIFDGFAREANYNRAKATLKSLDLRTKQTIEYVKWDIYKKYVDVIKYSQVVKVRKENFLRGQKDLERIQAQFDAGVIAKTSVYAQSAELGTLEIAIIRAENDLNLSKTTLMSAMGVNPNINAVFIESSIPTIVEPAEIVDTKAKAGSLDAALARALKNRKELVAADFTISAAKTNVESANAAYFPQVTADGGWTWSNNEFGSFREVGKSYIGVGLSLPIFDNFSTNSRVESARLQVAQSEFDKQRLEQNIRTDVQAAYINLEAAEKQMEISKRSLEASKMNYESTKEMFYVGTVGINEFTTANTQYITAQIENINSVYLYLQARKDLLYSTGIYE